MKPILNSQNLARLAMAGIAAGALSLGACKKSTEPDSNAAPNVDETALAKFKSDCEAAGGTVEEHGCEGMNSCKGESFQLGVGTTAHDCKSMSKCQGASCVTG